MTPDAPSTVTEPTPDLSPVSAASELFAHLGATPAQQRAYDQGLAEGIAAAFRYVRDTSSSPCQLKNEYRRLMALKEAPNA